MNQKKPVLIALLLAAIYDNRITLLYRWILEILWTGLGIKKMYTYLLRWGCPFLGLAISSTYLEATLLGKVLITAAAIWMAFYQFIFFTSLAT
jgi:hypothetical protein